MRYRPQRFLLRFAGLIALLVLVAACGSPAAVTRAASSTSTDSPATAATLTTTTLSAEPTTAAVAIPTSAAPATAAPRSIDLGNDVILAAVANSDVTSFSMAMYMEFELAGDGIEFSLGTEEPLMTGVTSGDRYRMVMDLGAAFGPELLAEMGDIDLESLRMEMVGDSSVAYMLAPLFNDPLLADAFAPGMAPPDIGDGWAVISLDDLAELYEDLLPEDVLATIGGQNAQSADQFLALAEMTRLLDSEGVLSASRGDQTTKYTGTITMADMLEQGGLDRDDFETLMASVGSTEGADDVIGPLLDVEIDMAIDIDDEGRVRELTMDLDFAEFFSAVSAELGGFEDDLPADAVFEMSMRIELFDYSDEAIDIEFPADDEVTADLGEWITALL